MRATLAIVTAIIIVFVVQMIVPTITDEFALVSSEAFAEPWTFVTSMFLHGDVLHIGYNLIALVIFGLILESVIGARKFLLVFFGMGILAGIVAIFFYTAVIGASGAIFGIIGVLAVLRPRLPVWALGVPMPLIAAASVWLIIDLLGTVSPSNVANIAHIAGLIAGAGIGLFWRGEYHERRTKKQRPLSDEELDAWEEQYLQSEAR